MTSKARRRGLRRRSQPTNSVPLDLTHEEVLADLDPGWLDWRPEKATPKRRSRAA